MSAITSRSAKTHVNNQFHEFFLYVLNKDRKFVLQLTLNLLDEVYINDKIF